jgi:BirA family transcriptional regulator, biotin operon repressor / biotin---[acetyl-CoA-carboxylase] ligase
VIGMGANLAVAPDVPGRTVACLAHHVAPPPPERFAATLLARLDHWRAVRVAEGFAPIRAAWLVRAPEPGSAVTLRLGEQTLAGSFAGLGDDGSLLLAAGGRVRAFATGEVLL